MPAEEMISKGSPFHTVVFPPPRNVGTPDSAETPAPVKTSTRFTLANCSRSASEMFVCVTACIWKMDVSKPATKSQFRDLRTIQYNSRLLWWHRFSYVSSQI